MIVASTSSICLDQTQGHATSQQFLWSDASKAIDYCISTMWHQSFARKFGVTTPLSRE